MPMVFLRHPLRAPARALLTAIVLAGAGACAGGPRPDPLAGALGRVSDEIAADTASDPLSREIRAAAGPALDRASAALHAGRRRLALFELARAMPLIRARQYVVSHRDAARSLEALEAEWRRMDGLLAPAPGAGAPIPRIGASLAGALAEAALPQARIYYDASLDYGRSNSPDAGLFYMGQALAQQALVAFADSVDDRAAGRAPDFRSLAGELDALESEILSTYRPPAAIEQHPRFIAAASALKEARELDALGLRRGAMLRYLQGSLRAQPLAPSPPVFDGVATPVRLDALEARLGRDGRDHDIARLFIELARADVEDTTTGAAHETAAAVAEVVLPRYLAALEPAASPAPAPEPVVTVTLVRWPYT